MNSLPSTRIRCSLLEASVPGRDDRFFMPMFIGGTSSAANEGAVAILSGRKNARIDA
jgi:hypothetical protein